ncbi:MAG: thioredoxin fold domain-containing protein [Opitutae bacterium]|nr:thioredoxin fold domain-containing protein [Opitutae bacterium]
MKTRKLALPAVLISLCALALSACNKADDTATATEQSSPATYAWNTTLADAAEIAKTNGSDIYYLFTGTSWCPACITLENTLLNTDKFAETAEKLVLVRTTVERAVADNTEETLTLLARYRVSAFPTAILFDSEARPYAEILGASDDPNEYLARIAEAQKTKEERDAIFAEAKTAPEGLERAKVLASGLEKVVAKFHEFYPEVIAEIEANDANDELGFAAAEERERQLKAQSDELQKLVEKCVGENGERTSPEAAAENIKTMSEFLERQDLQPAVRQAALRFIGESYGFMTTMPVRERVAKIREYFKMAVEAAPDTRTGEYLSRAVEYYDDIIAKIDSGEITIEEDKGATTDQDNGGDGNGMEADKEASSGAGDNKAAEA